ncbi:MAG: hypothetical protein JJ956_13605 [Pseudomonadales bacterium]|nr:hypothetical protein [Pseudomonadales bacterium]
MPIAFLLLSLALVKILLDVLYVYYIVPTWAYLGFGFDPVPERYVEGWIVFGVAALLLRPNVERISDVLLAVMMLSLLAPVCSVYGLAQESRLALYSVLLSYVLIALFTRGPVFAVPIVSSSQMSSTLLFCWSMTLLVLLWLVLSSSSDLLNFDIQRVYDFREQQDEVINQGLFPYLNVWAFKVFNPVLIACAVARRNWSIFALLCFFQFLFFGFSNHKAVVLYPFLILGVWWLFSKNTASLVSVTLSVSVVLMLSFLMLEYTGAERWASVFIRRAFFVIANNTFDYFDFFSKYEYVYWSNSVLGWIFDYQYELAPSKLIGEWRGNPGHVNNSFVSTGFMHAGLVGVVVYSLIVGTIFKLYDALCNQFIPIWFGLAVSVIPVHHLITSADLFTALLTHGMLVSIFTLWSFRNYQTSDFLNVMPLSSRASVSYP